MFFPSRFVIAAQPRPSRTARVRRWRNARGALLAFLIGAVAGLAMPGRNAATATGKSVEPVTPPPARAVNGEPGLNAPRLPYLGPRTGS
jgi:hypothetical protein